MLRMTWLWSYMVWLPLCTRMIVTIMIRFVCVYYDAPVYLGHMSVRYIHIHAVFHDACCRIDVLSVSNAV